MISLIRQWFCNHEYHKHVDNTPTTDALDARGRIYPYSIYKAYIYCSKCGNRKRLN
jgi:hypothetical protein